MMEIEEEKNLHILEDEWSLYSHLPHDIDWSLKSYKKIFTIKYVEEIIELCDKLPEQLIKNSMLFIMRKDINPIWEDPKNQEGGSFSYKIMNKNVKDLWKKLSYALVGESLINTNNVDDKPEIKINGITISPKKNFCIIKIWVNNCSYQKSDIINSNLNVNKDAWLFKKHIS